MIWKTSRLDECCEIVGGATPSTSVAAYWDGDICWATPKDLSVLDGAFISDTPRKVTRAGLESCAASILPTGSVLFSSRAPIGHVAVNTVPMATNQGFKSFIPKSDKVWAGFLYWWLRANRPYLESLGNGATFKEVSKAIVSRIEIPLPPLSDQRRIADILDRAEALRAKRRAALALLDTLTQAIFIEMFGHPTRSPKHTLGTIRPFVEASSGKSPHGVESDSPTAVPIYGGNGIKGWATRALIGGPALVFGRVGQQCGVTHLTQGPAWVTDNAIVVRVTDSQTLDKTYLSYAFAFSGFSERVKHLDLPFINQEMILDFGIPMPPIPLQLTFAHRVAAVEKLKATHRTSLTQLDELFASLQHRAFQGEL